jgi:hypothetical protein
MKLRFLGLLAALGIGSAAVLVYASQSRPSAASLSDCPADPSCSACPLGAEPVAAKDDGCCASEAAPSVPVTATVEQE